MYLKDPTIPFEMMKEEQVWYNVDDFKQEMATKANRVYARCQQYLEEAKGINEKAQCKKARIKTIQVGDRVYVRRVPTAGTPAKLQPAYTGPYRVTEKVSDVVVKLRNIRNGKMTTLHTDRIRIIHEDNATPQMNPNVRRAYPVHEPGETRETKLTLQTLDPFPVFSGDVEHCVDSESDDNSLSEASHGVDEEIHNVTENLQEEYQGEATTSVPYSLRSRTSVPNLPFVMHKPLEYGKRK